MFNALLKRSLFVWVIMLAVTFGLLQTVHARRLKVYQLPKKMAPGQFAILTFENPGDQVKAISKCSADPIRSWVKSDIPILRIEQNGKQMWIAFSSYQTQGDSVVASFVPPPGLSQGPATLYLMNDHDASIPYQFTVAPVAELKLNGIQGSSISSLSQFRLLGEGFVPVKVLDQKPIIDELETNIGLSKLSKSAQWVAINHRMIPDWDKLDEGDFLTVEQNGKTWRTFVDQCSLTTSGLALDFVAPPDLKPGTATLVLSSRFAGKEVGKTAPLSVNVQ